MTKQKKIMSEELHKTTTFFDAYEFLEAVNKHDPGIGIATIYRFLKIGEEQGILHSYECNNRKIYSMGKKNHIHFRCEQCGEIKHLQPKNVDFLHQAISGKICHFQIDVTGTCEKCLKKA